ncbi:MAG: beta-eliminating lyase-related protein [Burkholderiaceae bacterium]
MAELAAPFDLAMVSLSKGLGAPGGSMLAGSTADIGRAALPAHARWGDAPGRDLAAAAMYALDHHVTRLADDHANARRMAAILARGARIELDPADVQTNILVFRVRTGDPAFPDAHEVVLRAREQGVLVFAFDDRTIRAVTHLDVDAAQCEHAANVLVACADKPRR